MYRIIATMALAGIMNINHLSASKPMDEYQEQMRQAAQDQSLLQLPGQEVMRQTLSDLGMDYFNEKTDLIKNLSNQQLKKIAIYLAVEKGYRDYFEVLKKGIPPQILKMTIATAVLNKPLLIDAIIKASKVINEN